MAGKTHLERDEEWRGLPVADDLGAALMRYLESAYSVESPLLILGHPGSGKSLLTRVYAARLQYPRYTVVRVELRDADPAVSIQKQVEDQIRKDTGYDVNWADLVGNLPLSPPVVILDGYDELLQATGKLFTDYLDQVQRFQRDGLIQDRPVRVIVTSRITLIDKAIIPPGSAVMRLESFDEPRRTEWIAHWNACNADYFRQAGLKPFTLPANEKVAELAEQPLLLLMLAIFDSASNGLSSRPDLDQTLLYDELLRRFIERELGKGEHGTAFSALPSAERRPFVDRELNRLGVAAIGMFNRQDVKILRDQLDRDLAYFAAERPVTSGLYGQSQSELLLGSFFFIHESRSRLPADGAANGAQPAAASANAAPVTGRAAFEFLHNTFGEFLAADFILRHVITNAAAIQDLTGKPTLEHTRQRHLASLTPYWFASLLYTPLHTRPNILALLREWSFHRIPADPSARAGLLSCLDEIVGTQIRALLAGTGPLDLSARARAETPGESAPTPPPYEPLPVLGHVAVYTLNLILLRAYLSQQEWTLDEPALDAGDRPWDRLTALWRSWFTPESLGTLATQFTATRTGTLLTLKPARSALTITPSSQLNNAYNAATALADNLTAASTGLHVVSLNAVMEDWGKALLDSISKAGDLAPIAHVMRLRAYGDNRSYVADTPQDVLTYVNPQGPELMLRMAELIDRTSIASARSRGMDVPSADMKRMVRFSRYHAELLVHACMRFDPLWLEGFLPDQTFRPNPPQQAFPAIYSSFLSSAAAAPVLRAAVQRLSADQCKSFAGTILDRLTGHETKLFDVDTAAALAVLAWRGSVTGLCMRAIDAILQECRLGTWELRDIPLETWARLTDALLTDDPVIQSRRQPFAAILNKELESLGAVPLGILDRREDQLIEFQLHALRITRPRDLISFLQGVFRLGTPEYAESSTARRRILLLLRWAHENDDAGILEQLLSSAARPWWTFFGASEESDPAAIGFDRASVDLTYREVVDLRWALDVWREAGAHGPGGPRQPHAL